MQEDSFWPTCQRPNGLIPARRLDPKGVEGPTRGQVRGRAWTRVAPGLYAPTDRPSCVEQRILEQSRRLGDGTNGGAVTGWAALRWRGGGFFDGIGPAGEPLPIPLLVGVGNPRPAPGSVLSFEQLAPSEREWVDGLWLTTVQRAVFDEMRRVGSEQHRLQTIEMAAAARLTSVRLQAAYVAHRPAWTGVPGVRKALAVASDTNRSPRETWMHRLWRELGLPPVLSNRSVYDLRGHLVGMPDLFDVTAGVVGEYQGAHHKAREQHRCDVAREERFRNLGIEVFELVAGDSEAVAKQRMLDARARAKFQAPDARPWTLEPPPWVAQPETLDHYLERTGRAAHLTHR